MKKRLLLAFLFFSLFRQVDAQSFTLHGQLKNFEPVSKVFFVYNTPSGRKTDSIIPIGNKFKFKTNITEPALAYLKLKYADTSRKAQQMAVFMEPAVIRVVATGNVNNITVTGSASHKDYEKLMLGIKPFDRVLDSLQQVHIVAYDAGNEALMKEIHDKAQQLFDQKIEAYGAFVRNNPKSPIALYTLRQYAAGYTMDPMKVESMFALLPAKVQAGPSAVAFKKQIETAKITAIGQPAPEFTQPDTLGNTVSLSSFRGKYVLIDLWASWCGPCRAENPAVLKAFNRYKDKNFTVLGVSLDQPNGKAKWMDAIHKDGLTWTQVSDLKYWDNAVAKLYDVKGIPQNFLIGPDGKIVAKNLRGEALEKKLEEILGE